jgi:hypothetical protein
VALKAEGRRQEAEGRRQKTRGDEGDGGDGGDEGDGEVNSKLYLALFPIACSLFPVP